MKILSKLLPSILALAFTIVTPSVHAYTGDYMPMTFVVVKNQLKTPVNLVANYQILGVPVMPRTIAPGSSASFLVVNTYIDVTSIHFSYSTGTQSCRFDTTFVLISSKPSIWTKSGTSTGSTYTNCDAAITNINSYSYTAQFTLR